MKACLFLLSPASCSGRRAALLIGSSRSALAGRLRSTGAPIGEVFTFISQLYFRGKLTYSQAFARLPAVSEGDPERRGGDTPGPAALGAGVFVITTSRGLVLPQARVTVETLREFAAVDLNVANDSYARPLEASAQRIASHLGCDDEVVLLGSIATGKYVDVLMRVFGERLLFPREFVGRGDMSRGGLMLRCVREGRELDYVPLSGAVRHGARPPKLTPVRGSSARNEEDL